MQAGLRDCKFAQICQSNIKLWVPDSPFHFATNYPTTFAMLTKYFHQTQVCISPFFNIERGNGAADTYFRL